MPSVNPPSRSDMALYTSSDEQILTSKGPDDIPEYRSKATSDQTVFSGMYIYCAGDSQFWGSTLDDPDTQSLPAVIASALAGATVINGGINTATSATILAALKNAIDDPTDKILLWIAGRNDLNTGLDPQVPRDNTLEAVSFWGDNPYLIFTIPLQDDAANPISVPTTANALAYNQWIRDTFPGKYVDWEQILADNADPANATDQANVAAGISPYTERNDYVHPNAIGHALGAEGALAKLSVMAPASGPVLEPKSLANIFGFAAIRSRFNRINAWQRLQKFVSGFRNAGVGSSIGDGTGFAIGGVLGGVDNRWLGFMKFVGVPAAIVRALGQTIPFSVSSSTSNVADTTATRTKELEWGPNGWRYYTSVSFLDDNVGVAVGSVVGGNAVYTVGLSKFTGSSGSFVKLNGISVDFFRSDSTTSIFAGTRTSDMKWSDGQFAFTSMIFCNGDGYGTSYGNSNAKSYAIMKQAGNSGAHVRQANGTILWRSSSASDPTTGTYTTELTWNNSGFTFAVAAFGLTATAGTNTTQFATTAFVTTAVSTKADTSTVNSALALKADDSVVVHKTGSIAETITGEKKFSGNVGINNGANTPRSPLDVRGTVTVGSPGSVHGVINSNDGLYINTDCTGTGTNDGRIVIARGRLYDTGGTVSIYIEKSGKIGIANGVSNPDAQTQINSASNIKNLLLKMFTSQTENPFEVRNSVDVPVYFVRKDGSVKWPTLADGDAVNESQYYSSTQNALCWKDSSGVVHPLY